MADTSNNAPDDDSYEVDSAFDYESFNRLFNDEDPNHSNLRSVSEVADPVPPPTGFVHASREIPPSTGYVSWSGDGIAESKRILFSISEVTAPVPPPNGFVYASTEVPPASHVSWSEDGFISESRGIADANDPRDDPMIWNLDNNESNQVNSLPGPSTIPVKNGNGRAGYFCNTDYDGLSSLPLPFWSPLPEPFRCSCCQVLRELVHSDGTVTTKLEIHGRTGLIFHAILEIRNKINGTLHTPECQMFDFCTRSIRQVKQFLLQYCRERRLSGFVKVEDTFSGFYEAVCVGMDIDNTANVNAEVDSFLNLSPTTSSADGQTGHAGAENGTTNGQNTTLVQRRRGKELQR